MKTFSTPIYHRTKSRLNLIPIIAAAITIAGIVCQGVFRIYQAYSAYRQTSLAQQQSLKQVSSDLATIQTKLITIESEDQYKTNQELKKSIAETRAVYTQAISVFEKMNDAKILSNDQKSDKDFALVLNQLSVQNYTSASATLAKLNKQIDDAIIAASVLKGIDVASLTLAAEPPGSGYRRQKVSVGGSEYVVDIATGDLNSTRVIVDTASKETCTNDCSVLSLGDYVTRNGAWAAINGSYFCPASYPSCAGKTNSFDLLVMNKDKTYFNSDNNVYSTNPAVIFQGSSVRFVGKAQEWGRDTGIDSMISNYPLLLMNKSIQFGGNDDVKMTSGSNRAFVAAKGNTVYIGVIHGVSVVGAAKVLQAMGMEHAINMDSGGSTAMWAGGGYKVGPGRSIPNAILFVRK